MQSISDLGYLRVIVVAPSAMAFTKNRQTHYVVYNFGTTPLTVTYSDGVQVTAAANQFGIVVQ
jgi:hypothetical protein